MLQETVNHVLALGHHAVVLADPSPAPAPSQPAAAAPVKRVLNFLVSYIFPLILAWIAFKILTRAHTSEMSKNVTTIGNVAIAAIVIALGGVIWGFGGSIVNSIFNG